MVAFEAAARVFFCPSTGLPMFSILGILYLIRVQIRYKTPQNMGWQASAGAERMCSGKVSRRWLKVDTQSLKGATCLYSIVSLSVKEKSLQVYNQTFKES